MHRGLYPQWTSINSIAVDTTASGPGLDYMRLMVCPTNGQPVIYLQDVYLRTPKLDAKTSIMGEDTVHAGQSYIYQISDTIPNAQEYERSYTGTGVTVTPSADHVQLDVAP